MSNNAPAVIFVSELINKAVSARASDIHLEPLNKKGRVRFRIDGILHEEKSLENELILQVIARIKVLAQMNLAERRIPQDGKLAYKTEKVDIDIRIATFPSVWGEKMVLRILDKTYQALDCNNLGLSPYLLEQIKKISASSSGFFLVTGPTGSGKTTTLHAMLSLSASPEKNVITLEDPVEYQVEGITQGQVSGDIGFTFDKGIRSLLRLDPDIIMVGEIRDKETAQVAIQAALTGHLVLSTLHTANTPGAIMRLLDMSVEPFLINAAVTGILAQRLARKLCPDCCYLAQPTQQEIAIMKSLKISIAKLHKSKGCQSCRGIGYKGRIGIFELLIISQPLRSLIINKPIFDEIHEQAIADGMYPLVIDGAQKVEQGIISLDELIRVIL